MASITKYTGKKGTTYRAHVKIKNHKPYTQTFDRRSEAMAWAEDVEYALRNDKPLPGENIAQNDMTLEKATEDYELLMKKDKTRSKHTIRTDKDTAKRLNKYFPKASLRNLTKEDIEAHKASRLRTVGPATIRQDMSMLSRIYETARIEWRMRDLVYPGKDVPLPTPPKERTKIVPEIAFEPLLKECEASKNKTLYPLVFTLLNTGMRPEEGVLLRWWQVNWSEGIIDLTKTKTDPRHVPLNSAVIALLKSMEGEPDTLVFTSEENAVKAQPVRFFRRAFEQACIRAGVNQPLARDVTKKRAGDFESTSEQAKVTLYTLRHTAATYLLMSGESLETVRDILGHKDISQTSKYVHISNEHKKKAVENENLPWKNHR